MMDEDFPLNDEAPTGIAMGNVVSLSWASNQTKRLIKRK
jgi:hypothetical protein